MPVAVNVHLRWGEYLGVAGLNALAIALTLEALMLAAATVWFGDPSRALIPFAPLALVIFLAAIAMRVVLNTPALERISGAGMLAGIAATALILIRTLVFPSLAQGDWRWLGTFGDLLNLTAEQPHAEVGMILMSIVIWIFAARLAQNAGDYEQRRQQFLRMFVVLVLAVVLALGAARGVYQVSVDLALVLPGYVIAGLLMMAQVRLAELRVRRENGETIDPRALMIWRVMTAGMTLATVLVVLIATGVIYGGAFLDALLGLALFLVQLLFGLLSLVGFILGPLLAFLANLFKPSSGAPKTTTDRPVVPIPLDHGTVQTVYAVSLSGALIVALIIALLIVVARLRQIRRREEFGEVREALVPGAPGAPPAPRRRFRARSAARRERARRLSCLPAPERPRRNAPRSRRDAP